MLEDAVAAMQERAAQFAGKHRDHIPTAGHPFVLVLVDEVAFLTAYLPDRQLRDRVKAALATLTTQGRAVGFCAIAALHDPRKEVMSIRNLFPDRVAMRLDELKNLGITARDTLGILGHSRIAVTMEVYMDADSPSRREAIGRLSKLLGGDPA